MTVKLAFKYYKDNNQQFGYCPSIHNSNTSLLKIRDEIEKFSQEDIEFLLSIINHNEHRWFVFQFTLVLKSMPTDLFIPIMKAVLSLGSGDWRCESVNDNIARLFGFKTVENFLQDEFINSYSEIYKRSIVLAFQRNNHSREYYKEDDDDDFVTYFQYDWIKNRYLIKAYMPDSQENAKILLSQQDELIQQRHKIILEYLLQNNINVYFFDDCSSTLPRNRASYTGYSQILFDKLIEKLKILKSDSNTQLSMYLKAKDNNWDIG